ncbi:hypothetical protein ACMYYO_08765 [Dermacoccaceae bacterium W4C1]
MSDNSVQQVPTGDDLPEVGQDQQERPDAVQDTPISLGLAAPPETSDAGVDAALESLAAADGQSLATQLRAAEQVHQDLHARLSDVGD